MGISLPQLWLYDLLRQRTLPVRLNQAVEITRKEVFSMMTTARLIGLLFLVLAVAIPVFLWFVAGERALNNSLVTVTVLVSFGLLFLSGRWPSPRRLS